MSNSNLKQKKVITPERAAIILPTIISAIFVFIIMSTFTIPKYVRSNKVNSEYKEYLRKKEELPRLRSQYKIINEKLKKLNDRKTKIIDLVSGKSNLETFIERIGSISKNNGIKIVAVKPKNITKYIPLDKKENPESTSNIDPLLVEGIEKYTININFESDFENLLTFLRELEFQEGVILFENFKLNLKNDSDNILEVSMELNAYGKSNIKKDI